jgi:hypothetical protein
VKRGERGTFIVYAPRFTKHDTDTATGEELDRHIPFLSVRGACDSRTAPARGVRRLVPQDTQGGHEGDIQCVRHERRRPQRS